MMVLFIIVFAIVAGFYFAEIRKVSYGGLLTIFLLVASLFTFSVFSLFYAGFVLPRQQEGSWRSGVVMLFRSAILYLPWIPDWLYASNFPGHERLPPSFKSLRAGVLKSHVALAVNNDEQNLRPAGPGFTGLAIGEDVDQALDLHLYWRKQEVCANTKDGIPLHVIVSVTFQVRRDNAQHDDPNLMYQIDQAAVTQISRLTVVDENNKFLSWTDRISPQAASYAVSEIAQFTINELTTDPDIFTRIKERVQNLLEGYFARYGVQIIGTSVFVSKFSKEITLQRLAEWKTLEDILSQELDATRDAETERRMKKARAEAQVKIVEKIMENIQDMRQTSDLSLAQAVNLRVVETLVEAIAMSPWQTHFPGRALADLTFEMLRQMQSATQPLDNPPER